MQIKNIIQNGIKLLFNNSGFTLIEILVVILIISILAAVALPQYNKSVKKAKGREVLHAAQVADKALTAYYLTHGNYNGSGENYSITAADLDIGLPELKYFNYATSTSGTPSLSSTFQRAENRADAKGPYLGINFYEKNDEVRISIIHRNGKADRLQCYAKNNTDYLCDYYFNCHWETYSVAMCPREDCPVVTYTECFLN